MIISIKQGLKAIQNNFPQHIGLYNLFYHHQKAILLLLVICKKASYLLSLRLYIQGCFGFVLVAQFILNLSMSALRGGKKKGGGTLILTRKELPQIHKHRTISMHMMVQTTIYLKAGTAREKLCTKHIQKHHILRVKRRKTELQAW